MAKIVKTRRRIKKSVIWASWVLALIMCFIIQVFLRSYNDSLAIQNQKIQEEIVRIKSESELIKVDIQKLKSQDRINQVASANNMKVDKNNVISINE